MQASIISKCVFTTLCFTLISCVNSKSNFTKTEQNPSLTEKQQLKSSQPQQLSKDDTIKFPFIDCTLVIGPPYLGIDTFVVPPPVYPWPQPDPWIIFPWTDYVISWMPIQRNEDQTPNREMHFVGKNHCIQIQRTAQNLIITADFSGEKIIHTNLTPFAPHPFWSTNVQSTFLVNSGFFQKEIDIPCELRVDLKAEITIAQDTFHSLIRI